MRTFNIEPLDSALRATIQDKIDNLTKPKGSLGMLEELALQIGLIQRSLTPQLRAPHHILFAADHGIVDEGVSVSPKEVTYQMIYNFVEGGAGICFLTRQHGFKFQVVDAGVDHDLTELGDKIIHMKIRRSTRNYLHQRAMSDEESARAIDSGAEMVDRAHAEGCNIISFGEMGITNTSSSSLWMSLLTDHDLKECVGAGSDFSSGIVAHKYKVLKQALDRYDGDGTPHDIMAHFGGYEMVMSVGAMLRAAELGIAVIIDGFIMSACALMAIRLNPTAAAYFIYGHQGDEGGHKMMLDSIGAKAVLNLSLRLGEGTGAICAYPIIESAVRMINEMRSFKSVEVTKYF